MGIAGNHVTRTHYGTTEQALGGAPLMRRNHVLVTEDVAHGIAKPPVALRTGVGLVPAHDARPLLGTHGRCAGVGQQVDQHMFGVNPKRVVAGLFEDLDALGGRRPANGFDDLDSKRFNDCAHNEPPDTR